MLKLTRSMKKAAVAEEWEAYAEADEAEETEETEEVSLKILSSKKLQNRNKIEH